MEIVKKDENFYSLVASKKYDSGDIIFVLSGAILSSPTRTSIELYPDLHIEDEHGKYMNHSFDPTCYIDGQKVVAMKSIYCGDELTFNYNENETNMACPFEDMKTNQLVKGKMHCEK